MPSFPSGWSPTTCGHTAQRPTIWGSKASISAGDGRQSSREFASADPATGAQDATLKSASSAEKFLSTNAAVYNSFNVQRHLTSAQTNRALRAAAMSTWRTAVEAD